MRKILLIIISAFLVMGSWQIPVRASALGESVVELQDNANARLLRAPRSIDKTYLVSSRQEYLDAVNEINSKASGEYLISLQNDISLGTGDSNSVRFLKNTTTIIGNNHEIVLDGDHNLAISVGDNFGLSSSPTVNLGKEDGTDKLTIRVERNTNRQDPIVRIQKATVNIYDGVIIKDGFSTSGNPGTGVSAEKQGIFNMYGGEITNCINEDRGIGIGGATAVDFGSTFNMYGGKIYNNSALGEYGYGGGVIVMNNSNFNMYGGTIEGNEAKYGGGVTVLYSTSKMNMEGGIIQNNKALEGGGIYFNDGSLEMKGNLQITDNSSNGKKDNLFIGTFPSGNLPKITGSLENSKIGVTLDNINTTDGFTKDYLVHNTQAPSNVFSSDDTDYVIDFTASGQEARLVNKPPVIIASDKSILVNTAFNPMTGVTAQDAQGNDITADVQVISNTVNTSVPGTYKVKYQVTDAKGTIATKEIMVTVNMNSYTITFDPNGGSVTPSSGMTDSDGKLTSLPTPTKVDYQFNGWFTMAAGGSPITTSTVFSANSTIYAQWTYTGGGGSGGGGGSSNNEYTITTNVGSGGKVSPDGKVVVIQGTDKGFTILPNSGYEVKDVKIDGKSMGKLTSYMFKNIKENHTIDVTFEKISEDVEPDIVAELDKLNHIAYVMGYGDNTFGPDLNMTRAEVTVIFSNLLSETKESGKDYAPSFKDMSPKDWFYDKVGYMEHLGIVKGYPDGKFLGNSPITRAEFVAIASSFDKLEKNKENPFKDVASSHWAEKYIVSAEGKGWIKGYADNTFKPEQLITRAEAVTIVNRMLDRTCDKSFVEINKDKLKNYTDVPKSHWAYFEIYEVSNTHEHTKNGAIETWNNLGIKGL